MSVRSIASDRFRPRKAYVRMAMIDSIDEHVSNVDLKRDSDRTNESRALPTCMLLRSDSACIRVRIGETLAKAKLFTHKVLHRSKVISEWNSHMLRQ